MTLKKHIPAITLAVALCASTMAMPGYAHPPGPPQPKPKPKPNAAESEQRKNHPPAGEWLRKYHNLPGDQQEQLLQSDPQFKKLPPPQQQQLQQRLRNFNNLPPQQQ